MTTTCPECGGRQLPDHPKGILTVDHNRETCSIGKADDSTTEADQRRAAGWMGSFSRPITAAEDTLLAAVGVVPTKPVTIVTPLTPSVLRRTWTEETA